MRHGSGPNDLGFVVTNISQYSLHTAADLFGVDTAALHKMLVSRRIAARGEVFFTPTNHEEAVALRDSLAKAVYLAIFMWAVEKINRGTACASYESLIGECRGRRDVVAGMLGRFKCMAATQGSWTSTGLSALPTTAWSSCASTMPTRSYSSSSSRMCSAWSRRCVLEMGPLVTHYCQILGIVAVDVQCAIA